MEAEAEEDVRRWLEGFYYGASADAATAGGANMFIIPKGERMVDRLLGFNDEPAWLPKEDLDVYVAEFERTGLRGGLNRYRNHDRDFQDLASLRGQPLRVPVVFIGGDKDGPTAWGANAIARFPETLPLLTGSHILENCGHWVQQEKADEVNHLLMDFLADVRPI